jgi:hypothetical protein
VGLFRQAVTAAAVRLRGTSKPVASSPVIMFAAIIDHPGVSFLVGVAIGTAFGAAVAIVVRRKRPRQSVGDHLRHHFGNVPEDQIEVQSREFPYRVCIDAYDAVNDWISKNCEVDATWACRSAITS